MTFSKPFDQVQKFLQLRDSSQAPGVQADRIKAQPAAKQLSALNGGSPAFLSALAGLSAGASTAKPKPKTTSGYQATAPGKPSSRQKALVEATVKQFAADRGWTGSQWNALHDLVTRESGWNHTAKNPTSSAYGLFQFLDSTRSNYGITRDASLNDQIQAGLQYIQDRYKTPEGALNFWLSRRPINGKDVGNWY